jgi:hypothetical protein
MPTFLRPEAVRFELRDGAPVITLDVDVPTELTAGEWSLLNRLTMVVVDGPGDDGFLLPRISPAGGDAAPAGWDDAVERAAGCHVVFGTDPGAPTITARSLDGSV